MGLLGGGRGRGELGLGLEGQWVEKMELVGWRVDELLGCRLEVWLNRVGGVGRVLED